MWQGCFFPEHIVGWTETIDNTATNKKDTVLTDIRINEPITPNTFQLQYPSGTTVADRVKGTRYRVDSSGNPISKEVPLEKYGPPPILPRRADGPSTETSEEPRSVNWLLYGSVGLLALGILLVVRHRRQQAVLR